MRLVVDTNVFVSAALMESSWSAMVVRWLDKYDGLLKSIVTEQELFEVLQRPRIASKIAPSFFDNLRTLFAAAELVFVIGMKRVRPNFRVQGDSGKPNRAKSSATGPHLNR